MNNENKNKEENEMNKQSTENERREQDEQKLSNTSASESEQDSEVANNEVTDDAIEDNSRTNKKDVDAESESSAENKEDAKEGTKSKKPFIIACICVVVVLVVCGVLYAVSTTGANNNAATGSNTNATATNTSANASNTNAGASANSNANATNANASSNQSTNSNGSNDDNSNNNTASSNDIIEISLEIDASRAEPYGYTGNMGKFNMSMPEGSTVYDALVETGADLQGTSTYISSINGLAEKSCNSAQSGWMYSVNGNYAEKTCGEYKLSNGDVVKWEFWV